MVIPGRILTLSGVEIGEKSKRSKLVNEMKTEAISMLAAKDMCVVEGIDENALPLSTADRFPLERTNSVNWVRQHGPNCSLVCLTVAHLDRSRHSLW